ncbi:MAG: tetratricopeptide repeat protein [Cyanobacteria bacterium J083]|nr:MAG: tetratricopeptide repeat protein [Cyanobacteria bacterium J083]
MTTEQTAEFSKQYQAGKIAFERGQYRLSIEQLENAITQIPHSSKIGGEVQMWLVNAYQADGKTAQAIALCQTLCAHPHLEIRKQAKNLLYIIKAPRLERPASWMTKIPELDSSNLEEGKSQYFSSQTRKNRQTSKTEQETSLLPSQINRQDNQFIWVALILTLITGLGLFIF